HPVFLEAARHHLGVLAELFALAVHAAIAGAGDNEGERAVRVPETEVPGRVPTHREAADVRLRNLQGVEHAPDVLSGALLRVRLHVVGDVRRRVAPRIECDRPIASGEETALEIPTSVVP